MTASREELVLEMEQDPSGHDIIDVRKLLQDFGFERLVDGDTELWKEKGSELRFTFPVNARTIPPGYAKIIAQRLRENFL